ncbi:MAG: division/cell wall cluster transcriptional repressor MraZ [Burkholderiales bacterium]
MPEGVSFQGASYAMLDGKGRLSVPKRHRDVLEAVASGQLTVTRHTDKCLAIFPRTEWPAFSKKISELPQKARWVKRMFLGHAMDVELDSTGRILVPPELRSAAALTKEIVLLGMGSYLELWDKAIYDEKEAEVLSEDMPDVFEDFSF